MRVWHRYIQVRARGRSGQSLDAGIGLVELLVAITLLAGALIGTAAEVAVYVKQQGIERTQVVANHLAASWFEYAESQLRNYTTSLAPETVGGAIKTSTAADFTNITTPNPNPFTTTLDGVTYTEQVTTRICPTATITGTFTSFSQCTGTGTPGPTDTIFSTIKITWALGKTPKQLTQTRNLADDTTYQPADTTDPGGNALSNCTRAGAVTSESLILTPVTQATFSGTAGRVSLDGTSGKPTFNPDGSAFTTVAVTLKERGLVNVATVQDGWGAPTCVPLYWTDTNGIHQIDLHSAASGTGGCSGLTGFTTSTECWYTGIVTAAQIKKTGLDQTTLWDGSVPFCAKLLGTTPTCGTNTTTDNGTSQNLLVSLAPSITCTVNGGVAITRILGSILPTNVACTVGNAAKTDTLTVTPPVRSVTMSSSNGTSWTGQLSGGTYPSGTSTWTFKITRSTAGEDNASTTITLPVTALL